MKPVTQSRVGVPLGNCTEACIASILEVGLEKVPDLYDFETEKPHTPERWEVLCRWLKERGHLWLWTEIRPRSLPVPVRTTWPDWYGTENPLSQLDWEGFHFLAGPNPDGLEHCIVGQGGHPVWDPNPRQRGIVQVTGIGMLARLSRLPLSYATWPAVACFFEDLEEGDARRPAFRKSLGLEL